MQFPLQQQRAPDLSRNPESPERPLKIIVFGSYGRRESIAHSDIDLLVILPALEHKQ
ncbi:nucleotidyltransferase domain-containing protein [Leptolyngbya sp. PCC 6406]|uniref:nucleotidyltransferase domain-containing protein n=1 Tax=Leptolyngbya sp. PCC 6406 TaxID=1173264 RepID=UPI0009DFFA5D